MVGLVLDQPSARPEAVPLITGELYQFAGVVTSVMTKRTSHRDLFFEHSAVYGHQERLDEME